MTKDDGMVVWLTGLSGSGKSTLADAVAKQLTGLGWTVEIVDGDELRRQLSAGLGFSRNDREENARRAACMAEALARHADFVLVALITPYRASRCTIAAKLPNYREVYVNAPLAVCEARDPKGLYRRARAGQLRHFTGLDDPYEPPLRPDLECRTDEESIEQSTRKVLRLLQSGAQSLESCVDVLRAAIDAEPGITMMAFARRMGITPRALAARLRASGQNFRRIRDERLLARAQYMLRRGCQVKRVASSLQFSSLEAFDRFFRRVSGFCPGKFKSGQAPPTIDGPRRRGGLQPAKIRASFLNG